MQLSERIAPYLPYLRRYARAVTGSQTSGDAYVAAVLETLVADTSAFPDASSDRVALYKLLATVFGSVPINNKASTDSPFAWERHAASKLAAVSPRPRQAFLLVSVEDFSAEEGAEVLGVEDAGFDKLLAQASEEISRQVATDVMIIEDEPLIAMDLEQIMDDLGHRVTGVARTHREAVDLFEKSDPKIILADIQLADGSSGIDAVNDILKSSAIPVIFVTAFPERLLTGNRPEPTLLVTKPFNPDALKALISQALFFDEAVQAAA